MRENHPIGNVPYRAELDYSMLTTRRYFRSTRLLLTEVS